LSGFFIEIAINGIIKMTTNSPFELTETATHVSHDTAAKKIAPMDVMQAMMETMRNMSEQMLTIADKLDSNTFANPQHKHKMYKHKVQMKDQLDKSKQTQDPSKRKHHMQNHMQKMLEMMADMKMAKMDNSHSEASEANDSEMMKHHKEIEQRLDDIESLLEQLLQHQAANLV